MGSISFRQGQKALACRLAIVLLLLMMWREKKTQSGIIVPMMQHHCQTSIDWIYFQIGDDEDKTMMMRPSWHTTPHSQRCPSAPKYPATDQGAAKDGRLSVFGDCFVLAISICEVLN